MLVLKRALASVLLGVAAWPANAQSVRDLWQQRAPGATFQSSKSALALEMCVGLELSEYGTLAVLHGEGMTLVNAVGPANTLIGIRITDRGRTRELTIAGRGAVGSPWLKRGVRIVAQCV